METLSVGKKKGHATTANRSARDSGCKEKRVKKTCSALHNAPNHVHTPSPHHIALHLDVLDFFDDRAQPPANACSISGAEPQ
jgi:hypothetical protein